MPPAEKTEIRPWPKWAPLSEAAHYARMGPRRLLRLVQAGKVIGHRDPEDKRGGGDGAWWISIESIDQYHDHLSGQEPVKAAVLAYQQRVGLS